MNIKIKKFCELCELELDDLVSAMFTGTGYAINPKDDDEYEATRAAVEYAYGKEGTYVERIFASMLMHGKTLVATDPEGKDHDFTLDMLEKGLDALLEKAPDVFRDFVHGDNDMGSGLALADCTFFGEIVYG
jgi:hypothetical protein